jgi:hypothetical protein
MNQMKRKVHLVSIVLMLLGCSVWGQTKPGTSITSPKKKTDQLDTLTFKEYYFTHSVTLTRLKYHPELNYTKDTVDDVMKDIKQNGVKSTRGYTINVGERLKFYVDIRIKDTDIYVIQMLPFPDSDIDNLKTFYYSGNAGAKLELESQGSEMTDHTTDFVYLISADDLLNNCKPFIEAKFAFDYGSMTYPIIYRPSSGNFLTTNSNLGGIFGASRKIGKAKQWNFGAYLGIGVTSQNIDSTSTDGKIKKASTAASITESFNIVFAYSRFQIVVGVGLDQLCGETSLQNNSWIYKDKPWVGIGVGFSIFTNSTAATSDTKQTGGPPTKGSK